MIRLLFAAGMISTAFSGCSLDVTAIGVPQQPTGSEPDPTYVPKDGDREQLYGFKNGSPMDRIPLFMDITAHDKFMKLDSESDVGGLTDMEERAELSWTESGSRAAIISIRERPTIFGNAAEVRLLDGSQRNRVLFTSLGYVVRLRPAQSR